MLILQTFIIFVCVVCGGGLAYGQTATPHPNALPVGVHDFTLLTSPEMELTGTGWSIRLQSGQYRLNTREPNDTLTFWVQENADYLIIHRDGLTGNSYWDVCIDATCQTINDRNDTGGDFPVYVQLLGTNSEVVITKNDTNRTQLDFMQIILDPNSIPTVSPTATPEPYYIYGTITGVSGTVSTRFDMVVTAGDVAVTNSLIFLFFSLWAIFLMFIIRRNDV